MLSLRRPISLALPSPSFSAKKKCSTAPLSCGIWIRARRNSLISQKSFRSFAKNLRPRRLLRPAASPPQPRRSSATWSWSRKDKISLLTPFSISRILPPDPYDLRGEQCMVDVKRRKAESFESLLRRFSRRLQQSGKMLEARKHRFHKDTENKNTKRASALRRLEIREKRDYLLKVGKLIEEPRGAKKRR